MDLERQKQREGGKKYKEKVRQREVQIERYGKFQKEKKRKLEIESIKRDIKKEGNRWQQKEEVVKYKEIDRVFVESERGGRGR